MNIGKQEIKALAMACDPVRCADEAEEARRLAEFYSELTPEVVLALLTENDQLDRLVLANKVISDSFRGERDQLKDENDTLKATAMGIRDAWREDQVELGVLRKDAERWRFVRNAVPNRSSFAVWHEGSLPFLGSKADEAVDAAMAKEASQ